MAKTVLDKYVRLPYIVHDHINESGQPEELNCGWGIVVEGKAGDLFLFPVGVLCKAIHRTRQTIVLWEQKKERRFWRQESKGPTEYTGTFAVMPQPTYKVPGSRIERWYSQEQIDTIRKSLIAYEADKGKTEIDWWAIAEMIETVFKRE